MESTSGGKHRRINALASEVARHQQFRKSADFSFNSRRLHHSTQLPLAFGKRKLRSWQAIRPQSNALSERSESKGFIAWQATDMSARRASLMAFGLSHDSPRLQQSTMPSSSLPMHFLYILRCADASLYIGETDDIERRIALHRQGRACAYTAKRLPVEVVYREELANRVAARRREHQLKGWTRRKKEALVAGDLALLKRL